MPAPYYDPRFPTADNRGVPWEDRFQSRYWEDLYFSPQEYADQGRTAAEYDTYLAEQSRDTSAPVGQYYDPISGVTRGGAVTERQSAVNKWGGDTMVGKDVQLQAMLADPTQRAVLDMLYRGIDANGNPLLDPRVMGLMEALGYVPEMPSTGGAAGGGQGASNTTRVPGGILGQPGGQLDDVPNDIPVGIAGPGSSLDDVMNTAPMPPPTDAPADGGRKTRDDLVQRPDAPPVTQDTPHIMGAPAPPPPPMGGPEPMGAGGPGAPPMWMVQANARRRQMAQQGGKLRRPLPDRYGY